MESPEEFVHDASKEVLDEDDLGSPKRRQLVRAIRIVDDAARETTDPAAAALLAANMSMLLATGGPTPIGQCKQADPFADIYVVFDSDGHRYECTHDPPHSTRL